MGGVDKKIPLDPHHEELDSEAMFEIL